MEVQQVRYLNIVNIRLFYQETNQSVKNIKYGFKHTQTKMAITSQQNVIKLSYKSSQYIFLLTLCENISQSIHPLQLMINPFDHSIYFQMKSLLNNTSLKVLKKNVDYYQCFYCEIIHYFVKNVQKYFDLLLYVAGQIQIQDIKKNQQVWDSHQLRNISKYDQNIQELEKCLFYLSYISKIQYQEYNKNIKMNHHNKLNHHMNMKPSIKQKYNKIKHISNINTKSILPHTSYANNYHNKSSYSNINNSLYSSLKLNSQLYYQDQQNYNNNNQFMNHQELKYQILNNSFQYYLDQIEDVIKLYKKFNKNVYENIDFNVNLYQIDNKKKIIQENRPRNKSRKRSKSNRSKNTHKSSKSNNKGKQYQKQKNNQKNNMNTNNFNQYAKQPISTPPRLPHTSLGQPKIKSSHFLSVYQQTSNHCPQIQPSHQNILSIIQILDNQDVLQQYQDIVLTKSYKNYKKSYKFIQKQDQQNNNNNNILINDFMNDQNILNKNKKQQGQNLLQMDQDQLNQKLHLKKNKINDDRLDKYKYIQEIYLQQKQQQIQIYCVDQNYVANITNSCWRYLSSGGFGRIQIGKLCYRNLNQNKTQQGYFNTIIHKQMIRKSNKQSKKKSFRHHSHRVDKIQRQRKILQILQQYSHPNIMKFYMSYQNQHLDCIFSQYQPNMSLDIYFKKNKKILSIEKKIDILLQAVEGVKFLHQKGIIHLDIKLGNFIVSKKLKIMLTDFGQAFIINKDNAPTHRHAYTIPYCAPQIFDQPPILDHNVDCYAICMCIIKMLFVQENILVSCSQKQDFLKSLKKNQLINLCLPQKYQNYFGILNKIYKILLSIVLKGVNYHTKDRIGLKWVGKVLAMCKDSLNMINRKRNLEYD